MPAKIPKWNGRFTKSEVIRLNHNHAIEYGRELIPLTRELIAKRQAVSGEAAE